MEVQAKRSSELVAVDVGDVLRRVLLGKYVLLGTTLLGAVVALGVAYSIKPYYLAEAVFLPPKYSDLSAATPAASLLLGSSDSSDVYLGLLQSRAVQDDVVEHVGLQRIYKAPTKTAARAILTDHVTFGVSRNSLIFVRVKETDAQLTAAIANGYLAALYRLNSRMSNSSFDLRREFFQRQLDAQKNLLSQAESALKQTQERTGIILTAAEAQAGLAATADLQAQLNAAETRLAELRVSRTEQAPEMVEAKSQLSALRTQLARQSALRGNSGDGLASNRQMPAFALDLAERERDVKLNGAEYDALVQQLGKARLASIDPGPQLQVVDQAVVPEITSGPNHRNILVLGIALGLLTGLLYLVFFQPSIRIYRMLKRYAHPETRI